LPDLETVEPGYRDSAEKQCEKDKIFTEQIIALFATLNIMEERAGECKSGKISTNNIRLANKQAVIKRLA
jgi:hypothetical protein